jgi:phosphate transport system substrate-binding protein
MYANMKRMNNDMAVSPIVATLVLIVVAVIGAVAVGTIMGTFSTSVSKNVNANQANAASQSEILVAGSTTVDPITQAAGALYSAQNPGVKIVSQAIASGAGVQAVGNGVADIGAISEPVKSAWMTQFPNLKQYQIGEGAIAIITNKAKPVTNASIGSMTFDANGVPVITYADLQAAFSNSGTFASPADFVPGFTTVVRADSSGTATVFYTFLGVSSQQTTSLNPNTLAVNGNEALVQTVGSTSFAIGFADYGDSVAAAQGSSPTVEILSYVDGAGKTYSLPALFDTSSNVTKNWNDLRGAAKYIYQTSVEQGATPAQSGTAAYNITMIRPLSYLTNGQAPSNVQDFINFMLTNPQETTSAGTKEGVFQETNNFAVADIS